MSWPTADRIHRTEKILIDGGKAKDPDEAHRFMASLVLQVAVGSELAQDAAAQAALATVVNAGHRAYRGGVHVCLDTDPIMTTGWMAGMNASAVVERFGGRVVDRLTEDRPTLAIGHVQATVGTPVLHLTWRGWSGGVVQSVERSLDGEGIALAGIAAAALGVSETFQQQLGAVVAGRRDIGVSLWRPDLDWRSGDAVGPSLEYLPARLWLLGLGHLGQAYAWTLGMLPYAAPTEVELGLMDFDVIIDGNATTQLLVGNGAVGQRKTRIVSAALEGLGLRTRLVEREYDNHFHAVASANPSRNEPTIALTGFDDAKPRRLLGGSGFARVVDAGLGAGPVEYLDIVVHTFPALEGPATAFAERQASERSLPNAYESEIARLATAGVDEGAARCGVLDIAGVTVGAAFVGTFASTLVLADILRVLHGGADYSVVAVDLRSPSGLRAVMNVAPGAPIAPAFTRAL